MNELDKLKRFLLFSCLVFLAVYGFSQPKEITVMVTGFKSDKGTCIVYLFNNKKDFPTKADKAIKTVSGKIYNGKCTIQVKDIQAGEYAIAVVHDENDNGKMDTGFLGIPKEGVGASNNAKSTIGPPKYEEAKFQYNGNIYTTNIRLKYL